MGEDEFGRRDFKPAEIDEVYVYRPRAVFDGSYPAELFFYPVHQARKLEWIERRLEYRDGIEEFQLRIFRGDVDTFRFNDWTFGDKRSRRHPGELGERFADVFFPVAEV